MFTFSFLWSGQGLIRYVGTTLPKEFRADFHICAVIIDCFKILLNGPQTWWQELRHDPNIIVTVLLVIAGDVEQNPGPSASSSMGSVNNLHTGFRRESSVTDSTGAITPTALACLWVASYSMYFSVHLHPPETSTNWERTQPSPGDVLRMKTRRQYYAEYLHLQLLMKWARVDMHNSAKGL